MVKEITSVKNATYKFIKSLKLKKERQKNGMFTVEGVKSVRDAIEAGSEIVLIAVSDKLEESFDFEGICRIPDGIFAPLCDTDTPQGVIAVLKMRQNVLKPENALCLYCDRITDPGNMGTVIRICDAVDAQLLLSPGCVDIYSPKTVRASMGSFFHTKICENVTYSELESMKNSGYTLIAGALSGETADYRGNVYGEKTVIIIGNEANGVCKELIASSDKCVKIPIYGKAESLNAAVAAAVILYKAREFK